MSSGVKKLLWNLVICQQILLYEEEVEELEEGEVVAVQFQSHLSDCSLLAECQLQFGWWLAGLCEAGVQRIDLFTDRMKHWFHVRETRHDLHRAAESHSLILQSQKPTSQRDDDETDESEALTSNIHLFSLFKDFFITIMISNSCGATAGRDW